MGDKTEIEWADATWNPVQGCTKISPGCANCYAERIAERFRGVVGGPYEHGFDLTIRPDRLDEPRRWKKPRRIFCCSMSDLFHKEVPQAFQSDVAGVMEACPRHTFLVLTKRADRLNQSLRGHLWAFGDLPNIWWGVSAENRKYGLPRISMLRDSFARNRFLSIEPLLEDIGPLDLDGIGWVIVGGESGPGSRPMEADWVRAIRDQCADQGVPFFFKQWGGVRKIEFGRTLDGRTYDAIP